MRKCSHYVPFEERCPQCVAEGLAREAALQQAQTAQERSIWASYTDEVLSLDHTPEDTVTT